MELYRVSVGNTPHLMRADMVNVVDRVTVCGKTKIATVHAKLVRRIKGATKCQNCRLGIAPRVAA